jgi:tetratricopeptide (TPR) repeat protein
LAEDQQSLFQQAMNRHQANDLPAAEALYRDALAADPSNLDIQYLLGTALLQQSRFRDAADLLQKVTAARPDVPDAHNNLGVAYKALGEWEPAMRAFQAAIKANPEYSQAFFNLGAVMDERGLPADAEKCYTKGLELAPDDKQMCVALAEILGRQQKWGEAETCYRQLAVDEPDNPDLQVRLGFVLVRQDRLDEAIELFQKVLVAKPDYHEIHNNLGYIYERQGRLDEAVTASQRALEIRPDYAEGHNNLGTALKSLGRLDEACSSFRQALKFQTDFPLAEFNLGTTLLLQGDLAGGWPGYDRRGDTLDVPPVTYGKPQWDGSPLDGRTILLAAEQGLGDTIQFIRYAPLIQQTASRVIVHCPRPLVKLLDGCGGVDQLIVKGDELPDFDIEAPLLSLPRILGTTAETIPAEVPYLAANDDLVAKWQKWRADIDGFTVGICWQGNRDYPRDNERSLQLASFASLAGIPGVKLVSLQKGDGCEQIADVGFDVIQPGDDFDGTAGAFMDTAALMKNLDLVITSDTAVPHLAGALGVPVWVTLPFLPDWRWLLEREDSPWYPSMRLFRQPAIGDWETPLTNIAAALQKLVPNTAH